MKKQEMSKVADRIAKRIRHKSMEWEYVRDVCDQSTYQDMDCFQLDMLTDMVFKRLQKAT